MTAKTTNSEECSDEGYRPERLSFSAAGEFEGCRLKWKFHYVDRRILVQPAYSAVLGKFIHQCLEHFYLLKPSQRTRINLKKICTEQFPLFCENDKDWKLLAFEEKEIKRFKHDSWKGLMGLWEIEDPKTVVVEETEMDLELNLRGVPFKGFVDRVERDSRGRLVISDYKSGSPPSWSFRGGKLAQVVLYAAAVYQELGEAPHKGQLLYLGAEIMSIRTNERMMDRQFNKFETTWNDIHDALDNDEFPANPTPLCGWCPHVDICPVGQQFLIEKKEEGWRRSKDAPAYEVMRNLGIIE